MVKKAPSTSNERSEQGSSEPSAMFVNSGTDEHVLPSLFALVHNENGAEELPAEEPTLLFDPNEVHPDQDPGQPEGTEELSVEIPEELSAEDLQLNTNTSQTPVPEPQDEGDDRIGRFEVLGELGRGGMGRVLQGRDPWLHRTVAIKTLLYAEGTGKEGERDDFISEAQITGQLEHPGIVPVHDIGQDEEGRIYFVMKEIEGRSLKVVLSDLESGVEKTRRKWTRARLLRDFVSVCNAVAYAHSRGVLHRDIKPSNIMLGRFGEVILVDWGAALLMDGEGDAGTASDIEQSTASKARVGSVIGTPGYMSPEQSLGRREKLGPPSDVWSLGSVLYEILTFQCAYRGPTPIALGIAAASGPPEDPRTRAPHQHIPDEIARICLKAMENKVEDRYKNASELAEDIEAFLDGRHQKRRALALVQQATQKLTQASALQRRAARLWEQAENILQAHDNRPEAWARRDEARAMEEQAELLELEAEHGYHAALVYAPNLPEARRPLARRRAMDWQRAMARGDLREIKRARSLLVAHLELMPEDDRRRLKLEAQLATSANLQGHTALQSAGAMHGRMRECKAIDKAHGNNARLISLVGGPGEGKSRIACAYALEHAHRYPGGVWFTDLDGCTGEHALATSLASSLGLSLAHHDPAQQLGWILAGYDQALIVLDNFERAPKNAALTLGRWMGMAPNAQFLVTSRSALNLNGETAVQIDSLSNLAAIELFAERAKEHNPGFELTRHSRASISNIVRRIGACALAIELVAARCGALTPQQISDDLNAKHALRRPGARANQHAPLGESVQWAWRQLDTATQAALGQCVVFSGGFDLEAAEAVVDLSPWPVSPPVVALLGRLCRLRLVQQVRLSSEHTRYTIAEPIRAFVRIQNDAHPQPVLQDLPRRHAAWYAQWASTMHRHVSHAHSTLQRQLIADRHNLQQALEVTLTHKDTHRATQCALGLGAIFCISGPALHSVGLLDEVLFMENLTSHDRMALLGSKGRLLNISGRPKPATAALLTALSIALRQNNLTGDALMTARQILKETHDFAVRSGMPAESELGQAIATLKARLER